jgi:predicted GNAT family acetyltransferase
VEVDVDIERIGTTEGHYRLTVDGSEVGELDFHQRGDVRVLPHVGVRPAYEGQGLAARLTRRALDDARADGVLVDPVCPYVAAYLRRHRDDQDLIAR